MKQEQITYSTIECSEKKLEIRSSARYSSIVRNPTSKIFLWLSFLLLLNSTQQYINAQVPFANGPGVRSNFGVDADLYANKLQFGYFHYNITPYGTLWPVADSAGINRQVGSDDWFKKTSSWPGSGIGVIDTTGSAAFRVAMIAAVNANQRNRTFKRKMAYPAFTVAHGPNPNITLPYPVITPSDTLPPQLLLDAVAFRDNNSLQGTSDSSVFTSTADKNGDNPKGWHVGLGGVPQKNDLIDVAAHLRLNLVNQNLWGFAYSTTVSADGNSHTDYEIYRSNLTFNGTALSNFGPDSGHTAGYLNIGNGSILRPGDLLVAVDFENGGTNPLVSVRVWVDPNNLAGPGSGFTIAQFNALPAGPRPFSFTGVFNGGTNSGPYGWAEITAKAALQDPVVFTRVNTIPLTGSGTFQTFGAPWGNFYNSQPNVERDSIPELQFSEVGFNFTSLGLDAPPTSGPCFTIFGTLLIKTRSSSSFTAELKDFAGPFLFGNFTSTSVHAYGDTSLECSQTSAQLCAHAVSTSIGAFTYCWRGPNSNSTACLSTDSCVSIILPGKYYINTSVNGGCLAIDSITVTGQIDNTPPTISCPPPITVQCLGDVPPCYSNLAAFLAAGGSVSDENGIKASTYTCSSDVLSGSSCNGSITRTHSIQDSCGNSKSCTQLITIHDTQPPVIISCPAGGPLGCNPSIPLPGSPIATDNCSIPSISSNDVVTSNGCSRTLTRTYTATDACGNTATCNQVYTYTVDTQAPVITATGTIVNGGDLGCNPTTAQIDGALGSATATDNCGTVSPNPTNGSTSGITSNGCVRSQTRSWIVTDACNNTASTSRTIFWTFDVTPPAITATGSIVNGGDLGCNPTAAQINAALGSATATDNCGLVTPNPTNGITGVVTSTGCSRSQTRTWSVTDACSNTASVSRTISWTFDVTPPGITATGSIANGGDLGCNPSALQIDIALGTATATDNCGPVTPNPTNGTTSGVTSNGCIRTQRRSWTVTDACSNSSSTSRTISWTFDITPPAITATGSIVNGGDLGCNPTATQINDALGSATATDNCGLVTPNPTNGITGAITSTGCIRSQTRTWTATDACNNSASTSRMIFWTFDTTAPVISTTGTIANSGNLGCNPTPAQIDGALGTATATDNCGTVTFDPVNGTNSIVASDGCSRSQTRTWKATDACGNTASASRNIKWKSDTEGPAINCPGNIITCSNIATYIVTANDNCSGLNSLVISPPSGSIFPIGVTTVTVTATDSCGNSSSCTFTVTRGNCSIGLTKTHDQCQVVQGTPTPVNFTYVVTNTGNMFPASGIIVDDNGTPGNTADDVTICNWGPLAPGESAAPCTHLFMLSDNYTNVAVSSGTSGGTVVTASASASVSAINCTCNLAYPDNSNTPRSSITFNESGVLRLSDPGPLSCGTQGSIIKLWYSDEHALTLGVRRVIVKTAGNTTTTDYPIEPTPASPLCVSNPQVGTTSTTGDQSGNDLAAGGGRPLWPALFITDLTVNGATSRIGDWQQGGAGIPPTGVCGTWKAAVRTVDYTHNPVAITVTPDADPAQNLWNLGSGSDIPPGGFANLAGEAYGAEVTWNSNALGLIPGHTYRLQFMVHDGDQNKTGGDVGETCTTINIPLVNCDSLIRLGNLVWSDANGNGIKEANEVGINKATVNLYTDTNNDNLPDGPAVATTITNVNGIYGFSDLAPGNYIVGVIIPPGDTLITINGGDPDNDIDNDNNGVSVLNGEAFSNAVTLASGTEPSNDGDGTSGNQSIDFGLKHPGPDTLYKCYVGTTHSYVTATQSWTVDTVTSRVNIHTVFSKNFVDNTYGTTRIGWPGNHNFSDLTGADRVQIALYDAGNVKRMEFKLDYLSASNTVPSGYKSLGVTGDGGMLVGSAANVLSVKTSLDANFNDYGYVLTTNSPATDANYTPNPTYPNWIFDVWYDVSVSLSVFPGGFGEPLITGMTVSPSKTGSNTEVLDETVCNLARMKAPEITDPKELSVDAYPNPFGDNITIDFKTPLEGETTISITDITGRAVEMISHASGKINTGSNLRSGVYFVTIRYEDHQKVIKIVKTGSYK